LKVLYNNTFNPPPLSTSSGKALDVYSKNEVVVKAMTRSGNVVYLPFDLRVPLARYISRSKITSLKRYNIKRQCHVDLVFFEIFFEFFERFCFSNFSKNAIWLIPTKNWNIFRVNCTLVDTKMAFEISK
jgi:hypothetical protein